MQELIKPKHLSAGDTIATVSPSHGLAGDANVRWKYDLAKKRLEDLFGLSVITAPNSMRGSEFLEKNPQARAEDLIWAFENKNVKAIIANTGGNDSIKLLSFINTEIIRNNPKIFIGYSDTMNIHLLCYKVGLSTFYGHNLLYTIGEANAFHSYSEKWFRKTLFDPSLIGIIEPSSDWTFECRDHENENRNASYKRNYYPNLGYELIQGSGIVTGRLIGGHTEIMELENEKIALSSEDFENAILFIEDIPEFFSPKQVGNFFIWLGIKDFLHKLNGVIIGKICESGGSSEHSNAIRKVCGEFGRSDLPVLYGLNFGHTSPMFALPYGAIAEINCEMKSFAILEAGVI